MVLTPGVHQAVLRLGGGAGDDLSLDAGDWRWGKNAKALQQGVCLAGPSVVLKTVELVVGVVVGVCDV